MKRYNDSKRSWQDSKQQQNSKVEPEPKETPQPKPFQTSSIQYINLTNYPQGYLVVLGSYKKVEDALNKAKRLRSNLSSRVEVFYAVNDYMHQLLG